MSPAPALRAAPDEPPREDSVQLAHEALRTDILTGALPPGAMLSQVRLAALLGISRTPLREALRRLVAEGLVTSDFNRRMRVSALDVDDVDQIYAMRFALEPLGIAATVPALDRDQRGVLETAVEQMDAAIATTDRVAFRQAHRAFHLGLTARSGARINRTLAELWDHSERYRVRYLDSEGSDDLETTTRLLRLSQAEHREILAAALAGDVDACVAHLLTHLHRTLAAVVVRLAPPPAPRMVDLVPGGPTRTPAAADRSPPDG